MKPNLSCALAYNVHDSSVSFALDKRIVLVLEAERIFKEKKKRCNQIEMEHLVQTGLSYLKRNIEEVAFWSMTTLYNPFLNTSDIFGNRNSTPLSEFWKEITCFGVKRNVLIVNHHLAHAATFLLSPVSNALIISCDGGGDYDNRLKTSECQAVFTGKDITIQKYQFESGSFVTGKFYGLCSNLIYGKKNQEGKLMALAGFGKINGDYISKFQEISHAVERSDYQSAGELIHKSFPLFYGIASTPNPRAEARDFCASLQSFFIKSRISMIRDLLKSSPIHNDNLVMAGGVCLNLELNSEIQKEFPKLKQFIAPCCYDTGQSIGALCILISKIYGERPELKLPYLGMGEKTYCFDNEVLDEIVELLLNDGIVLLHNGPAEIGPRALGNRSFIARPDKLAIKEKLSQTIKQREYYRPIAPMVLEEKFQDYFEGVHPTPYMMYKCRVHQNKIQELIGCVHGDWSARVQTVSETDNSFLYRLIEKFGQRTGIFVLLNTSLNLKGDPIANDLSDSIKIYHEVEGPKLLIQNGKIYQP